MLRPAAAAYAVKEMERDGRLDLPIRHVMHVRRFVDELVPRLVGEHRRSVVNKRAHACHRGADAKLRDCCFRGWRIDHARRKFSFQSIFCVMLGPMPGHAATNNRRLRVFAQAPDQTVDQGLRQIHGRGMLRRRRARLPSTW